MNKVYRICIFSAQFLPHMGGVERYTYNLAKRMVKDGHKVTVVSANVDNVLSYEKIEGMKVYRMPCFDVMNGRLPFPKFNKEFRKIDRVLSYKNFDLVVINTRFYLHSLYGMIYAKRKKIRCMLIEHGTGHLQTGNRFFDIVGELYEHVLTIIEKGFCTEFYGVSYESVKWLNHFHIRAKGVLYNSVDFEQIESLYEAQVKDYRKEYKISNDTILIAFVGRLVREKGVLSLINAVEKMHERFQNICLVIAGEGELRDEIEKKKGQFILPLGKLEFAQVIALLRQTDIFCLPTAYPEGFPTSTLEAMACRCYPVVTDKGGAHELIIDSSYGKIIPDNSPKTLIEALSQVILDERGRQEVPMKGYRRVKEFFTWNQVAEKIIQICENNI